MTDNQDSVTAGAVQPPTDRPLTAGDFPWIKPMAEALAGYEADYGEGLDDMHELGRIDESRATPSFRIRVGHVRALAEILSRPATSAASEGARAIAKRLLSTNFDFLHPKMEPSEQLEFEDSITNAITNALASPPVSERERELEGALREIEAMCPATCETSLAHDMAQIASEALTAQPAGEGK